MANYLRSRTDTAEIWDLFPSYAGELAFDVGANGGEVASVLANRFSHVVAYEPCVESFWHLSELGPPVHPSPLALTDHVGKVSLIEADLAVQTGQLVTGRSLAFSWGDSLRERVVDASTLDAEAEKWGVPDFIKIDTEGHEARVVAGGTELFSAHHPQLLIEIHDQANAPLIEEMLGSYTFRTVHHSGYAAGTAGALNHFWLVSDGA